MRIRDEQIGIELEVRVAERRALVRPLHVAGLRVERDDLQIGARREGLGLDGTDEREHE